MMLKQLSSWLEAGSEDRLRTLVSTPPWFGNEGGADAPLSLLLSLAATLRNATDGDASLVSDVERVIEQLAPAIDAVSRDRVRTLETRAATDSLTGAMSRSAVLEQLEMESARTRRHGRNLSVVYMDVDGLKQINDEHGHPAGDVLLVKLAKSVNEYTRAADMLGRLGGDEFLLMLPETDLAGAQSVVEKLKPILDERGLNVTMGAAGTPDCDPEPDTLIASADASVRALRAAGR